MLPGRVVLWGNRFFESRSNAGITAQQEEVRREVSRRAPRWVSRAGWHCRIGMHATRSQLVARNSC